MKGLRQKVLVQKVRKNCRNEPVFIGKESWSQERAGPLKWWLAPLKLRGPPLIIKGAAQTKRQFLFSFLGKVYLVKF